MREVRGCGCGWRVKGCEGCEVQEGWGACMEGVRGRAESARCVTKGARCMKGCKGRLRGIVDGVWDAM